MPIVGFIRHCNETAMSDSNARRDWVSRVLGVNVGAAGGPPPLDLSTRLAEAVGDIRAHNATEQLGAQARKAAEAVKAGAANAEALLDALELATAALVSAQRRADAAATAQAGVTAAGVGLVAFAKLRIKLRNAVSSRDMAAANLEAACSDRLKTPAFLDDPRSTDPKVIALVANIGERVPPIEATAAEVEDALDNMASESDPTRRRQLAGRAQATIKAYRASLDAEPLLVEMEQTEAGSFAIHSAIAGALDELDQALAA